jgi:hypothetical protein
MHTWEGVRVPADPGSPASHRTVWRGHAARVPVLAGLPCQLTQGGRPAADYPAEDRRLLPQVAVLNNTLSEWRAGPFVDGCLDSAQESRAAGTGQRAHRREQHPRQNASLPHRSHVFQERQPNPFLLALAHSLRDRSPFGRAITSSFPVRRRSRQPAARPRQAPPLRCGRRGGTRAA